MIETSTFPLRAWRRPWLSEDSPLWAVGGVGLIFLLAAGLLWPRHPTAGAWQLLLGGLALESAALALVIWFAHARYGDGAIGLEGDTLIVDDGRAPAQRIPIRDLRAIVIRGPADPARCELRIEVHPSRWVRIPVSRLTVPVDAVAGRIRAQVALHGDLEALDTASDRYAAQTNLILLVCAVIALGVAIWRMFV